MTYVFFVVTEDFWFTFFMWLKKSVKETTVAESLITRLQKSLLCKNGGCFRETSKYQCLFWFPTREHSISSLNIMTMATSFLSPQLTLQKTGLYM